MSIALMTAAFKAQIGSTHKFVLLALCDNANDQGECYPSVAMLCEKTSLSDRAVQKSIVYLEQSGFIRRDARRGTSTYYYIADPRTWFAPERSSPPNHVHPTPERDSPPPPNHVRDTPEPRSPRTINEPSDESSGNHQKRANAAQIEFDPLAFMLAAGVDADTAKDWLKHRKAKKASTGQTVFRDRAKQASIAGISLGDALAMEVSRNWQGFEASWLQPKGQQARASPAGPQALGKAGQATAANAQRLLEKMANEQTS